MQDVNSNGRLSRISASGIRRPRKQGDRAIAYRASVRDLHRRLKQRSFDWPFVRSFVLPEWWEDEMADVEANRALAEAYIARQLRFSAVELRDTERPLTLPPTAQVRFKRYKNQVDDKVRASTIVALRAAEVVVRSVGDCLPVFSGPRSARDVRNAVLRRSQYVDLDSLLRFCWEAGIAVIPLAHVPSGSKRFDGMAAFVDRRPIIVLASGRDGPPWLTFHVAHELGHILLGHARSDMGALVDGTLASATGSSTHEREADRFACEVLWGDAEPRIRDLKVKAPRLAVIAAESGPTQGVDPGVFVLVYARSNNRWPVAQSALKYLGLESGGQEKVAEALERYLAGADLSEADERFLSVLGAA